MIIIYFISLSQGLSIHGGGSGFSVLSGVRLGGTQRFYNDLVCGITRESGNIIEVISIFSR